MKNTATRVVTFLLAIMMLVGVLPLSAFATIPNWEESNVIFDGKLRDVSVMHIPLGNRIRKRGFGPYHYLCALLCRLFGICGIYAPRFYRAFRRPFSCEEIFPCITATRTASPESCLFASHSTVPAPY